MKTIEQLIKELNFFDLIGKLKTLFQRIEALVQGFVSTEQLDEAIETATENYVQKTGDIMTGDLKFDGDGYGVGLKQVFSADNIVNSMEFNQDEGVVYKSIVYDNLTDLNVVNRSNISVSPLSVGMQVSNELDYVVNFGISEEGAELEATGTKGIVGNTLYNKQNDPLAYAQIRDIGTGFESGFTSTAQVIPATTDTIITLAGATFESDGDLNLIDGVSGKITPLQQGDVIDIDIAMPLLTPVGVSQYCTMTLVPFGTSDVYRAITHQFIKLAGNQDYISANWTVPIGADIITAGGLSIIINSTAEITIDQKYISVTRISKAKTT